MTTTNIRPPRETRARLLERLDSELEEWNDHNSALNECKWRRLEEWYYRGRVPGPTVDNDTGDMTEFSAEEVLAFLNDICHRYPYVGLSYQNNAEARFSTRLHVFVDDFRARWCLRFEI